MRLAPLEIGVLAEPSGPDTYRTEIVEVPAGEGWVGPAPGTDTELLVIDGSLDGAGGPLGCDAYTRLRWRDGRRFASAAGCRLLVKTRGSAPDGPAADGAPIDPARAPWAPGHGRLRVLPLDTRDVEGTALVLWPAGERFVLHRHLGGEEIFVLSGTFRDEHGSYPAGSWIQSPHGSAHHPFVEEETLIWVKTGHLAPRRG